jgi:hypothetical protein
LSKIFIGELPGLDCFFHSGDHRPEHFHVKKKGCWEIRVYFSSCTEEKLDYSFKFPKRPGKNKRPTGKEEKTILKLVIEHRERLLKEWEEKVSIGENNRQ